MYPLKKHLPRDKSTYQNQYTRNSIFCPYIVVVSRKTDLDSNRTPYCMHNNRSSPCMCFDHLNPLRSQYILGIIVSTRYRFHLNKKSVTCIWITQSVNHITANVFTTYMYLYNLIILIQKDDLYLTCAQPDHISKDFSERMPLRFLQLLMSRTSVSHIDALASVFPR